VTSHDFASRPWRLRAWVAVVVPLGCALPLMLSIWAPPLLNVGDLLTAAALVLGSVLSVELGRRLEGGKVFQQRPHKALSAWPMAAIFLLPLYYIVPIVALSYAHARWRGVRVTLWKWIASASFLMAAGAVAGVVALAGSGGPPTLLSGLDGALLTIGAVAVFLGVEASLLGVTGLLNTLEDDAWIRRTLADPSFYLMEFGVLTVGALTGLIGATAPWFLPLLLPAFWFLQQSVLHRPLREQATHDPKTGLLHFVAWQRIAQDEIRRQGAAGGSWAVLFADIDNFRFYNQRHGHLGGDAALNLVARLITTHVRPRDLVARFGGEEFCVLLPGTVPRAAELVAERLRVAIRAETATLAEPVTVSIGVAAVEPGHPPMQLEAILTLADQALYEAKLGGRNTVRVRLPAHLDEAPHSDPADSRSGD
jgi:diguanylate cyclase (GGDEF)-like protein